MKQFRFQLDPVLDYKQQALDALMTELSEAQMLAAAQEAARDQARENLRRSDEAFAKKRENGFTNLQAMEYEAEQQVLKDRLRKEEALLLQRRKELEDKRQEVVAARQDTHVLEKLKELRRGEYDKATLKEEEKALDDLTAARRAMAAL